MFGVPDERLGEVPVAVIYHATRPAASTNEDCAPSSTAAIAAFKIPARFIFVDQPLPKLGTGKIDRVAIKAQPPTVKPA